jgi:hypothetical protein
MDTLLLVSRKLCCLQARTPTDPLRPAQHPKSHFLRTESPDELDLFTCKTSREPPCRPNPEFVSLRARQIRERPAHAIVRNGRKSHSGYPVPRGTLCSSS